MENESYLCRQINVNTVVAILELQPLYLPKKNLTLFMAYTIMQFGRKRCNLDISFLWIFENFSL